jgi:hypothetical protein
LSILRVECQIRYVGLERKVAIAMDKSTLVIIIDSIPKQNIGHHWQMAKNFRKAFSESQHSFVYLNPSADAAFREDRETLLSENASDYVVFPQGDGFFRESAKYVMESMISNPEKVIRVIFLWLQQLQSEDFREFLKLSEVGKIEISGISNIEFFSENGQSFYFENEFSRNSACKKLWVWSQNQNGEPDLQLTKRRYLPEYHPSAHGGEIQRDSQKLGFYGFLAQKRGLCEILIIGLFNRRVKIEIKGYGHAWNKMWRPQKAKWLKYQKWQHKPWAALIVISVNVFFNLLRYLPNVQFDSVPFENQGQLEKAISNCSFTFYAAHAPISSGIVLTSLASGVPVIWIGQAGEATRQLSVACGKGRIVSRDIFIPGKIERLMRNLKDLKVREIYSWEDFKAEVTD